MWMGVRHSICLGISTYRIFTRGPSFSSDRVRMRRASAVSSDNGRPRWKLSSDKLRDRKLGWNVNSKDRNKPAPQKLPGNKFFHPVMFFTSLESF